MAAKRRDTTSDMVIMSADELHQVIDTEARARLGMSGESFIDMWLHREIPHSAASWDIGILVRLLDLEAPHAR